uniref:ABC-2 type transporter domain-containing protein n=1 Tax=Chenopodium quinoa TaxID=63459 RepID=A0A803LGR1_CHEQI
MGIITGAGVQGVMLLGGGFFRLPDDLPDVFWRYPLYYISFHKYAFQGLFKNEFIGLEFPSSEKRHSHTMISGVKILKNTWQVEDSYSKWIDLAILLGMVVLYRLLFLIIVKTSEKIRPLIRALMRRSQKQVVQVDY